MENPFKEICIAGDAPLRDRMRLVLSLNYNKYCFEQLVLYLIDLDLPISEAAQKLPRYIEEEYIGISLLHEDGKFMLYDPAHSKQAHEIVDKPTILIPFSFSLQCVMDASQKVCEAAHIVSIIEDLMSERLTGECEKRAWFAQYQVIKHFSESDGDFVPNRTQSKIMSLFG